MKLMMKIAAIKNYLLFILIACNLSALAQEITTSKQLISSSKADTWVATDDLGRKLPTGVHGGIRKDKYVGIFYFVWHGAHGYDHQINNYNTDNEGVQKKLPADTLSPFDITKIIAANPDNPKFGPVSAFHYWGEPYLGYYLSDDEWVIRKHAQMLSDAGVDVIILDATNGAIYLPQYKKIAETYLAMRKEGKTTPSIVSMVNSNPGKTVQRLYENIYKKGLFKDLWFYWKGKPLLLCPPEAVTPEIGRFFSIRQSWAWSKNQSWFDNGKDKWPWIDHYPQAYGWHESKDKPEEISVAVAGHPFFNIGRSFHDGKEPAMKQPALGLHFAEQWKRAIEADPEFVFITGWNEWIAMRFDKGGVAKGPPFDKGDSFFVDEYDAEYSRDAEPVKGDFQDDYYYQMVDNIRKYKGARPLPVYKYMNKIIVDGNFDDWKSVASVYTDDKGDTFKRKHPGWGRIKEYINNSGRNDIIETKVASDKDYVSFYVKTNHPLTPWESTNWMHLFIGVKDSMQPGWSGFNYMINRKIISAGTTTLERCTGGWNWEKVANISYFAKGNELEIRIPKKALGITKNTFTIDFKWADNSAADGDAMHWIDMGDAAPNGRFAYRYIIEHK